MISSPPINSATAINGISHAISTNAALSFTTSAGKFVGAGMY